MATISNRRAPGHFTGCRLINTYRRRRSPTRTRGLREPADSCGNRPHPCPARWRRRARAIAKGALKRIRSGSKRRASSGGFCLKLITETAQVIDGLAGLAIKRLSCGGYETRSPSPQGGYLKVDPLEDPLAKHDHSEVRDSRRDFRDDRRVHHTEPLDIVHGIVVVVAASPG